MHRLILSVLLWAVAFVASAQQLSNTQLQAIKTAINANPTWAAFPQDGDGPYELSLLLNATASPAVSVWRTDCKVADIYNAITWASYTPTDVVSSGDSGDTLHRKNGWLLSIQVKQMNLQIMTQARETVNAALPNIRSGLRDATIQVPSGSGGANTSPGGGSGANVLNTCVRNATEVEKILLTASQASDTTGSVTARVMGWEGFISADQVRLARVL